jgi:uncharacterized protein YoxC
MVASPRPVTSERIYRRLRFMFIMQSIMFFLILIGIFILLGNQQQTYQHITKTTSEVENSTKNLDSKVTVLKEQLGDSKQEILSTVKDASEKIEAGKVKK